MEIPKYPWSKNIVDLLFELQTSKDGLDVNEAQNRLNFLVQILF